MAQLNPALFDATTPPSTINQFLAQLALEPTNTFQIYPRVVSYKSEASKRGYIARQTTDMTREEYGACDKIQAVKCTFKSAGTIIWLSGNMSRVGDIGKDNVWHTYIVVYHERELVIVDPGYAGRAGSQRRLNDIAGFQLVREFIPLICKRRGEKVGGEGCWGRAITRIRIGSTGFGTDGQSKCMSGQWLESFVQAGCPMDWFDGWEEIKRN